MYDLHGSLNTGTRSQRKIWVKDFKPKRKTQLMLHNPQLMLHFALNHECFQYKRPTHQAQRNKNKTLENNKSVPRTPNFNEHANDTCDVGKSCGGVRRKHLCHRREQKQMH
uniref:Uncharacterized protein n=1 Tax=Cacopsylla melanoneura TaxID=428564 RepID=A0A8D8W3X2_9HEMI